MDEGEFWLQPLDLVNRHVLIVTPKQPFEDWVNSVGPSTEPYRRSGEGTAYLIPSFDVLEGAEQFVQENCAVFFEEELSGWFTDESTWPTDLSWDAFTAWFDTAITDLVLDAGDEPLEVLSIHEPHSSSEDGEPELNWSAMEDCTLALMYITLHDQARVWKGYDWGVLDRLHERGLISNPATAAKSVILTERGMVEARRLFEAIFTGTE